MPVENFAFNGPQALNLTDRLLAVGKRSNESGYKTAQFILPANPRRIYLRIQNNTDSVLFLAFGGRLPTAADYDVSLKACAAAHDGTGGVIELTNNIDAVGVYCAGSYRVHLLEYYA